MKKLLYLAVIALFVASCSTSKYAGNRMDYGHKDVVKSEITKKEKVNFEVQAQETVVSEIAAPVLTEKKVTKKSIFTSVKEKAQVVVAKKVVKKALKEAKVIEAEAVAEMIDAPEVGQVFEAASKTEATDENRLDRNLETLIMVAVAVLVPFGTIIVVGYINDWDVMPMVYNALWLALCGLPGLIHAFIHIFKR